MKIASDLDDFHQVILKTLDFSSDSGEDQLIVPPNILATILELKYAHTLHDSQEISEEREQAGW